MVINKIAYDLALISAKIRFQDTYEKGAINKGFLASQREAEDLFLLDSFTQSYDYFCKCKFSDILNQPEFNIAKIQSELPDD